MTSLSSALQLLTEEIERRRTALLTQYRDEDLHQLRVTIRRLRGLLRNPGSSESRQLRRDWSTLVDRTNAARDWDTLVIYLEHHLAADIYLQHRAALSSGQASAQQQVLDALRSTRWSETFEQCQCYLQHAGEGDEPALPWRNIIDAARTRASKAWQTASEADEPRNWHRLRIAIKDLRYSLDTLAPASPESQATLALCKDVQTLLGDWHDTVVHRQLLEQLASREEAVAPLVLSLLPVLQTRGSNCLDGVRQRLQTNFH